MTQKIVINRCHGGFGLSDTAISEYTKIKGIDDPHFHCYRIDRNDTVLVQLVEELGQAANTPYSELKVVEIPVGVKWVIEEYDGLEWVAEVHRTWH
jgi:hypothetical protein